MVTMLYHPVPKKIVRRPHSEFRPIGFSHLSPLLQRIYQTRRVSLPEELDRSLSRLPSPSLLAGMESMTALLALALRHQRKVMVIGDYDADGATATAVALLGLKALGLKSVSYLVPNRFHYGYGLTPEIVELAAKANPDILLTVDNGISSIEGVLAARARGIQVLVTDHHLPGEALPEADAIVNPNLVGDAFPAKTLAGVGVMFYVLLALRQRLRSEGHFRAAGLPEPNLAQWLDLVALGTVADMVGLDPVNRVLVHQGLQRIRSREARPGILALMKAAGRNPEQVTAADLGFSVGPRLNAAGRLDDISLGIECLLTDDPGVAERIAVQLDQLNRDRRLIEDQMKREALESLKVLDLSGSKQNGLCLFDENWHPGVVGLVASRIKDRLHRPVVAFALANPGQDQLRGSARSIPGLHIRDVLADMATRQPGLLPKFGGHAMAAGLSLTRERLAEFTELFEQVVDERLEHLELEHTIQTDGFLEPAEITLETAELLRQAGPWGQAFPEPLFEGDFRVLSSRIVGERHLKMLLEPEASGEPIDAIAFGLDDPGPWLRQTTLRAAYQLDVNEFRGSRSAQLRIEYMESAA